MPDITFTGSKSKKQVVTMWGFGDYPGVFWQVYITPDGSFELDLSFDEVELADG